MPLFLLKRLLGGLVTLFVIATLCFFIVRLSPGTPFSQEKQLPAAIRQSLERKYGFDKPLHVQYARRMLGYATGDLGWSIKKERYVGDMLFSSLKTSIELGLLTFAIAIVAGVFTGIVAAARHNRLPDYLSMSVALTGICIPNFLLGPLLVLLFSQTLRWFPVAGWPTAFTPSELSKLVLPAITLSLVHVAYISRLTRAGMLDVLNKDFIRTARAKGVAERTVYFKHALKNAITPVLSYAGPMAAYIFTGSVVVESIFFLPGMGQHFVEGALNRDYEVILGAMLIYSVLIIVFNLIVDVSYSLLDPRVRLQ